MSFNWREFLQLAKELISCKEGRLPSEAEKRTAVSRAYYACFCHIRNYEAIHRNFPATYTYQDHKELLTHLKNQGDYQAANKLHKLRKRRNDCDYSDVVSDLDLVVRKAIEEAEGLLQNF